MNGHGSWGLAVGDVDGDGITDVAFTNAVDGTVTLAYGSRRGPRPGPTLTALASPSALAIGGGAIYVISNTRDEIVRLRP